MGMIKYNNIEVIVETHLRVKIGINEGIIGSDRFN